jgi:hypothetical protein
MNILFGNAAEFGVFSPLSHIDPGTWNDVVDLNLTANWRLTRAIDPRFAFFALDSKSCP